MDEEHRKKGLERKTERRGEEGRCDFMSHKGERQSLLTQHKIGIKHKQVFI